MKGKTGAGTGLEGYTVRTGQYIIGEEPSFYITENDFENYPFNLMSDLIVGEYDINPISGQPRSCDCLWSHHRTKRAPSGDTVSIIERARSMNPRIRILLNVTCLGVCGSDNSWYR